MYKQKVDFRQCVEMTIFEFPDMVRNSLRLRNSTVNYESSMLLKRSLVMREQKPSSYVYSYSSTRCKYDKLFLSFSLAVSGWLKFLKK